MSWFNIEEAKSSRSTCKKCKTKINKGELRIGAHSDFDGRTMTKWHKVECFSIPAKKFKDYDAQDWVREHLQDDTADKILQDDEKVLEIAEKISAKKKRAPAKKRKLEDGEEGEGGGGETLMDRIKSQAVATGAEPDAKKLKTSQEDMEHLDAYYLYKSYKNDELKDVLRWNGQMISGTKDVLLTRVIDGHVRGRLGLCTSCGNGKLKIEDDGSQIVCNGYFDEGSQRRIECFATFPLTEAPRITPWYEEHPGDEQLEQDKKMAAAQASSTSDKDGTTMQELETAVSSIDWDLSDGAGLKKATADLIQICVEKVAIPEKTAKMSVGKLLVAMKESSPTAVEVLGRIVQEFGFREDKKIAAEKKTKSIAGSCGHEANVNLLEAFIELGELYFKEGNPQAGITYRKAADAIRNLDFEVTEENAMGLGKTGKATKVDGIGKKGSEMMYEFVTTGAINKLDEKRAAAM